VEYALPKLNICTFLYMIYHSSIISRERCTSEIEHFHFLIVLHILPARIVLYFPILLHILPIPIVLYFLLDNFIIFLALHVKVALPEAECLYFLSTMCVLPRVTSHTSLILRMILSFLQPFTGTLHFPKLKIYTCRRHCEYFSSSPCVLPKLNIRTLHHHRVYFLLSLCVLLGIAFL
jgi:hypothetical protein